MSVEKVNELVNSFKELCVKSFNEFDNNVLSDIACDESKSFHERLNKLHSQVFPQHLTLALQAVIKEVRATPELMTDKNSPYKHNRIMENFWEDAFNKHAPVAKMIYETVRQRYLLENIEKAKIMAMTVEFNGQKILAESVIDVYWSGWECDSQAWLIKVDGKPVIVGSNHGENMDVGVEFLEERIAAYKQAIADTEGMIHSYNLMK